MEISAWQIWEPLLSYLTGIMVSFTPCIAVLFPITFYRFFSDKKSNYKKFLLYLGGFLTAFVSLGFIFEKILNSPLQNGLKLFFALTLILLGLMQFYDQINPLNLPGIKNPFIFGLLFALAIGVNPCAVPFTGQIFALSSKTKILVNLLSFGMGIITPPSLFLFFGYNLLKSKLSQKLHYLNKPMSLLLVASGFYMGLHILSLTKIDLILSSLLILFLLSVILKLFLVEQSVKDLFTIPRIMLILSVLGMWFIFTYHCYGIVAEGQQAMCHMTCHVCQKCLILFSFVIIWGVLGSILLDKFEKSHFEKDK